MSTTSHITGSTPLPALNPRTGTLRVAAESAYPTITASSRVRVAAFAPFLRDHGVELTFHAHVSNDEYDVLSRAGARAAKAIVVARCAKRVASYSRSADALVMAHKLLSLVPVPARDPPARVDVYDFDDALFHESTSSENWPFGILKRERERCNAHLQRARLVLAGNAYLASYALDRARRVEVVPSCVDPASQPLRQHRSAEVVTVGWIGSRTTTAYLHEVLPLLHDINRSRPRVKLVTVGAARLPDEPWLEQHRWSLETEAPMLASFDVGIMPLPDNEWARGKCGYKLLQYYAAGVPAIASPVGVNKALLERGGGIAARSPSEWISALEAFCEDSDARRQAGLVGRNLVESDYSYQRWAPELAAMFRSI